MEAIQLISLSMGAAWASGINLYAAVLMLGVMGGSGQVDLPPGMEVLSHPLVLTAAGVMFVIEFFADKVPGLDSVWDALHSFIRIPAGAFLAAGALGDMGPAAELAGYLLGGSIAAGTHVTKAGSRALINTSPEPLSNWTASISEDIAVLGGLWAALNHPWLFLGGLTLFLLLLVWLIPKLWRAIGRVLCLIGKLFGLCRKPAEPDSGAT